MTTPRSILVALIADLRSVPVGVQPTAEDLATMADHYESLLADAGQ